MRVRCRQDAALYLKRLIMSIRSRDAIASTTTRSRLRFELLLGSILLAIGLFLAPPLIYWTGFSLLGSYGENAGLSAFYGNFFADLASGTARVWILVSGPLVLTSLVRIVFIGAATPVTDADRPDDNEPGPGVINPAVKKRIEPRVEG